MDEPILIFSSSDEDDEVGLTFERKLARRHTVIEEQARPRPAQVKRSQSLIPSIVIDLYNELDTPENTVIDLTLDDDHLALNLQRQFSKENANFKCDLAMAWQQSFEREAVTADDDNHPPSLPTPPSPVPEPVPPPAASPVPPPAALPPPALPQPQQEPQRLPSRDPLDVAAAADDSQPQQLPLSRRAAVDNAAQLEAVRAARRKRKTKAASGDFAENFFAALRTERQPRLEQECERYARWLQQQEEDEARQRREAATRDLLWEQRRALTTFLERKAHGLRIHEVWSNPESFPGCRLYERFRQAWEAVPESGLRMCFHGTHEANIAPICRDGLDPARRAGQAMGPGEYFGGAASVSLGYCKGGRKMLVFCVLTAREGVTCNTAQVVVVNKPEHQLPIAVITFDHAGGEPAHDPWAAHGAGRVLGGVLAVPAAGVAAAAAAPAEPVVNARAAQAGNWARGALRKAQSGQLEAIRKRDGGAAGRKRGGGRAEGGSDGPRAGGGAKHVRMEVTPPGDPAMDDENDAELQEAIRRSMEER